MLANNERITCSNDKTMYCPPELKEKYPYGFMVAPDFLDDGFPDGVTIEAFCAPEIPLDGWNGAIAVCSKMLDGSKLVYFKRSVNAMERVSEDCLVWAAPVVWYGVRFE